MGYTKYKYAPFYMSNVQEGHYSLYAYPAVLTQPMEYTTSGTQNPVDVGYQGSYGDTPKNWRKLIADGEQAGSNMSVAVTYVQPGSVHCGGLKSQWGLYRRYTYDSDSVIPHNDLVGSKVGIPSIFRDSANAKALESFNKNARRARTQMEGGVIGGEFIKTLRLIRSPLKSLYYRFLKFQRASKKNARLARRRVRNRRQQQVLVDRSLTQTWLEYSFGWTPLVNDIDDIARYLAYQNAGAQPERSLVIGSGKSSAEVVGGTWYTGSSQSGAYVRFDVGASSVHSVKYKGLLKEVTNYKQWKFTDLGLGLENWIPTIWELIPYSFLVDYFSNAGDVISAASLGRGKFKWIMKWDVSDYQHTLDHPRLYTIGENTLGHDYGFGTKAILGSKSITRAKYTDWLIPEFRFKVPGLSMKWLNVAALANNKISW